MNHVVKLHNCWTKIYIGKLFFDTGFEDYCTNESSLLIKCIYISIFMHASFLGVQHVHVSLVSTDFSSLFRSKILIND